VASGQKEEETWTLDRKGIGSAVRYGPQKNLFFSCYYATTGVHALHVIGGLIPMSILCIQALRGKVLPYHVEYTGLYWHFVDLVWIFLFPLLYLI
jgi:cytochrome c oxidase subunit 3